MPKAAQVIEEHRTEIIRYDTMCTAIAECHRVDEVKGIRDRAIALEVYAAQALNMEAERKACEIRLRAERRAGELLKEMKRTGQRHTTADNSRGGRRLKAPTLTAFGITRDQSSKWQALAEVPQDQFEAALRNPATKPSTESLIRKPQSPNLPKIDRRALWIWGVMRDFERERMAAVEAAGLLAEMTNTMQSDVRRIAPTMIAFFKEIA